ncbi:MAG: hypothetical protein EA379_00830, partial [Phycisphaerales bacterium]
MATAPRTPPTPAAPARDARGPAVGVAIGARHRTMTIPLASLCVLVVAAGALVYVLSRLGALAGASAGEGRSERWLSVWLPITLALPLIVLALSAPGVDAANRTAPLNAFDALWPVFGLPAIAAAAGVFLVGMRSGAMSGEISGGGAPAMSQVGWGAGLGIGSFVFSGCDADIPTN